MWTALAIGGVLLLAASVVVIIILADRAGRPACTKCGSKRTTVSGEWDGWESHKCQDCGHYFEVRVNSDDGQPWDTSGGVTPG